MDIYNVDSLVVKEINCVTYIMFDRTFLKSKVPERREELRHLL